MSTPVNTHLLFGKVRSKHGPISNEKNEMKKSYLYLDCDYIRKGKIVTQVVRVLCFSWGEMPSRISMVMPGDEIKLAYSINGWLNPSGDKDYLGLPRLLSDIVLEGDVEILNTSQRRLYNNGIDSPKDDLGTFPMSNTSPISQVDIPEKKLDYEDPETGLPF